MSAKALCSLLCSLLCVLSVSFFPAKAKAGSGTSSPADSVQPAPISWKTYLDEVALLDDYESVNFESSYDLLEELAAHPLNINTMTREDFEQLPFLSSQQIEDIQSYLYQYGDMKSLGELAMIRSLGYEQWNLLRCFTYAAPSAVEKRTFPSLGTIIRNGRSELMATLSSALQDRAGDRNGYLGYKYKHWLRYSFSYGSYVRCGLLGSQDSGEPFGGNGNSMGYDYYSFWLQVKNLGRIRNLVIGRYRVRFGLGLIINNDFSLGKTIMLSSLGRACGNISPHSSRSSGNYLQGAACMLRLSQSITGSLFYSYRTIDASLNAGGRSIATVVKTGYHRTPEEMARKDNAWQIAGGSNINYKKGGFHAGVTFLYTTFDKPLQPNTSAVYNRWKSRGQTFWNAGIDYGYMNGRITVSGETATGGCGAVATINTFSWQPSSEWSAVMVQRFYSYKYYSIFANSFSEGSGVQDESGIYAGVSWTPSPRFQLKAYSDYAHFSWPQYGHTRSHKAWDNLLSATFTAGRFSFFGRYRLHIKDVETKNIRTGRLQAVQFLDEHRLRLATEYSGWLSARFQTDICYNRYKQNSFGIMISEQLNKKLGRFNLSATASLFRTDDYNSRLYSYERSTLYNISIPMLYGHGARYAFYARYDAGKKIMCVIKIASTHYFDRDHISTGLQQIDGSSLTTFDLQLKYKF